MVDFDGDVTKIPEEWLERMGKAESKYYRGVVLTTPSGVAATTNIDKVFNDSLPVNSTFAFNYHPNTPLDVLTYPVATLPLSFSHKQLGYTGREFRRSLKEIPIEAKEVKGKRLKKGTKVKKPFYQSKGHGKHF